MKKPDYEVWNQLLTQLDDPSVGTIAEELSDTRDIDIGTAYDVTEEAIRDGILIEVETSGTFSLVQLDEAKTAGKTETADMEIRGAASSADGHRDDIDKTSLGPTVDDPHATLSGDWCYPTTITERDWWVTWILDEVGRKRPVAPWQNGHAYPAKWADDLPGEERPETDYDTARRWVEFDLSDTGLELPESAQSDDLGLGIILPADRPEELSDRITLIDWDDVRDPDTEEIHPVAAEYIDRFGGYVEVSTSGEGLHQFVTGGLRHRGKFIAPIDEEPFIGDDLPQLEIYDGGRHVAMTGRHVAGTDHDVVEGQELIDELVSEYADAERDAGHRRFDPETGDDGGPTDEGGSSVPEPEAADYDGPRLNDLRETKPTDRSLAYHAAVEAFYRGAGNADGYASIQNWRLEGFVAALGERDDLGREEIKKDLRGEYLDETDVPQECIHRTPERIDYGYERAASDRLAAPSYETLVAYGILPEKILDDEENDPDEETDRDLLALDVVVEPAEAIRAARAVTTDDLDEPLPELERPDVDDVAIAVALAEGVIDDPDTFPRDDGYTEAYYRARDVYGAPLPKYLDNSTLEERFDLVTAAVKRVGPEHILDDLRSEVTVENPPGEAVAKIDPTWEDSESGERIVAGYGSGFYCVKHGVSFDPIQLVALENDLILDETVYPTGEAYKQAYRLLREEYGAPIPRWRATVLEEVTVLPPAVRLADEDLSAGVSFDLDEAREETEALVRDALTTRDRAQLVTVVPGGGKTFSTAIAAADHPILYAPPRNELKKQMEEYTAEIRESDEFDAEPDAYLLPILAENGLPDEAVEAAVAAVRSDGFDLLRDRETLLCRVEPYLEEEGEDDEDDEEIDLDRATCPSAEGEHGEEWRVAVQTARALGFRPSEIHRYDQTLFGDELPCTEGGACEYTEGWNVVTDVERCPDILIGSAGHAFVDSATSYYTEDQDGHRVSEPRAVVVDEFPGDTYATEYGSRYMDHATWLAEALTGVETREELLDADLGSDTWVSEWLDGSGADVVVAGEAIDVLRAGGAIVDAGAAADRLLERGPVDLAGGATSANVRGVVATLEDLVETPPADVDVDAAIDTLDRAADQLDTDAGRAYANDDPAAGGLYDLLRTLRDDILDPLANAAPTLDGDALGDAIADATADLPIGGDLRQLVDDAVAGARGDAPDQLLEAAADALEGGREGCRALAVAAESGYAHPNAWALLAGAIADADDDGVAVTEQQTLTLGDAEEPGLHHKKVELNGVDIHADRDHHGAVVFDRPSFTSDAGDKCPLVGLDATARRDLWRIALGRDAEVRDIHDTTAARRRHIREGMNHTVVQTANTPLPYHGDPAGRNFQEDLSVVETAAEEYADLDQKDPAVISTLKVLNYLESDLEDVAGETVNYENMKGSDALGEHQVAVVLGSCHYGDTEPERWAMYAGESAGRGETSGETLDYGSAVANTYLKHMREDTTKQAILRAGRNDDRSVVVAHTSALRDDLPVVAEGATVSAHSKGALAVAEAAASLNGRSFTAYDIVQRIRSDDRAVGLRQVQNILANFRSSGYLCVEREGSRGREYEYALKEDPGLAEVELPSEEVTPEPDEKTKNQLNDSYSWNFVIDDDEDGVGGMLPTPRPTIPAADTTEAVSDGVGPPS